MASPNLHRRSPLHTVESGTGSDWAREMPAMSPLSDDLDALCAPWMNTNMFSPTMGPSSEFIDGSQPLYTFNSPHLSDVDVGTSSNALGLNGVSPSSHMDNATMFHTPQGQTPGLRSLPQINTVNLHTVPSVYPSSPFDQSPYHPPLSATTSTPSSAGHHSIPRTPAALPSQTSYYFPTTHGGLLSPHPSYNPCYPPAHSPVSPSPSLLAPPVSQVSPSALNNLQTVWDIACRFPGAEHIIKQRPYRPNTQSDRRRYVEEVDLERPIMFLAGNGERCGIRCSDAMSSRFSSLYGRDDPMFENRGPSVSIRLMWPGYAPWSRQIPTRDFRSPPQPITRSKLAKNVAKTIKRFIEDMEGKPMEDDAHYRFRVGRGHITIDDLELVGLQHVSMGSWQAHIRLRH